MLIVFFIFYNEFDERAIFSYSVDANYMYVQSVTAVKKF